MYAVVRMGPDDVRDESFSEFYMHREDADKAAKYFNRANGGFIYVVMAVKIEFEPLG